MTKEKKQVTREDVIALAKKLADKQGGHPDQYRREAMDILMRRHNIKRKPLFFDEKSEDQEK